MPSKDATIIKRSAPFIHNGVPYEVVAFQEPNDTRLFVEALCNGQRVLVTYPDNFRAYLTYSVEPDTAPDFENAIGMSALDALIATAKHDIMGLI